MLVALRMLMARSASVLGAHH